MSRTVVTRTIDAPVDVVFRTVAHIDEFAKAIPHIVNVEYLSNVKTGVGARFRETRRMKSREVATELEVTEYRVNDRVRLVADNHGTVWDTVFAVAPERGRTRLTMTMDATTGRLLNKVMLFMIGGMVRRAIEQDMDAVKRYCER